MTRIERAIEIEAKAEKEAKADGDDYIAETAEEIIKNSCPGVLFDNTIAMDPFNLSIKQCDREPTKENCTACWNEPLEDE